MKKFLMLLVLAALSGGVTLNAQITTVGKFKVYVETGISYTNPKLYVWQGDNNNVFPGQDVRSSSTVSIDGRSYYVCEFDYDTYLKGGKYSMILSDDGSDQKRKQFDGNTGDRFITNYLNIRPIYYIQKTTGNIATKLSTTDDKAWSITLGPYNEDTYLAVINTYGFATSGVIDWDHQKSNIYRPNSDLHMSFAPVANEEFARNNQNGCWVFPGNGAYWEFTVNINGWEGAGYSINPYISKTIANNEKNLGTFSADGKTAIPDGVTAYIGKLNGDAVTLEAITEAIPANTGILYKGATPGATVKFYATNDAEATVTGNILAATGSAGKTLSAGDYVLATINSQDLGFYPVNAAAEYDPFKAYIPQDKVGSAAKLAINFGDETGIANLSSEKTDNVYYDLQGRRVVNPTKGLFIVNGKKVIL